MAKLTRRQEAERALQQGGEDNTTASMTVGTSSGTVFKGKWVDVLSGPPAGPTPPVDDEVLGVATGEDYDPDFEDEK